MAISSINTNLAALLAQQNIGNATTSTSNAVAALSSGNRLVSASTDVSALATGTALQSQVNILTTSLTVASQGQSLLKVADGALAQIQAILQRQQAIATQAQSGSLSSTQLGFLDLEFQNLTSQIDQLAGSTNFNGVKLLNGALSGKSAVTTKVTDGATSALTSAAAVVTLATAVPVDGDTVTINGVVVTFTTSAVGTSGAVGKVTIGSTIANTAANLANFLNQSGNPAFANLAFTASGAAVSAVYTGGVLAGTLDITASANFTTGANVTAADTTIAAGGTDGVGINRYSYSGVVTGTILTNNGASAAQAAPPIDITGVLNNKAFIGALPTITGAFSATDTAVFSVQVGDITYTTAATDITNATPTALTFTGRNSLGATAGGTFTVNIAGGSITATSVTSQSLLDPITARINDALSGISVYQNRDISSVQNGSTVSLGGIQVANLTGLSSDFRSNNFTNVNISDITITAPTIGSTDAKITAIIDGQTYTSLSGIGNQIGTNTIIALQNTSDPSKIFTIVTGASGIASAATTALDLSSQSNADAVEAALKQAFGFADAGAALTFQVGSTSTDTIGVSIGSSTTNTLFGGQALNVLTQVDAATAASVLEDAVNTITALRASVGALESRFNFSASAIQNAVQNQGAARSNLLDTDVAATSTAFATAQVQLQAGIAVLAQANQLQQNLLKLIG